MTATYAVRTISPCRFEISRFPDSSSFLLSFSSISMMIRLLLDVSIWLCLAPWLSLRQVVCSLFCFIFSIHFFGCLSWFLCPVIEQCIISTGSRSLPILDRCPNRVSLRCAILSTNLLSWCTVLHTHSSSGRALSPATISLTTSSLPLGFFVRLLSQTPAFRVVQHYWNYEDFIQLHFSRIWNIFSDYRCTNVLQGRSDRRISRQFESSRSQSTCQNPQ